MSERDCWKSAFENEALLLRPPDLMLINVRKRSVKSYRKIGGSDKKLIKTKPLKIEWNETLRKDCGHEMSSSGTTDRKNLKGNFVVKGHVFASRQVFRLDDKPKMASKRLIKTLEKCIKAQNYSKCNQLLDKPLKQNQGSSKFNEGEKIELNFKLGKNKVPSSPVYKMSCPSSTESCPKGSYMQVLRKGRLLKFTATLHAEKSHTGKYKLSLYNENDVIEIVKSVNIGAKPKMGKITQCGDGEERIFEYHRDCDGSKSGIKEGFVCCRNQLTATVRTQCLSATTYGRDCGIKKLKTFSKNFTPDGPTIMPIAPETLELTDPINLIEPSSAENSVMKIFGGVISVIFVAIFLLILKFKPRTATNDGKPKPNLNENHLPGAIQNNRIDSTFSLSNISNDSVFIN